MRKYVWLLGLCMGLQQAFGQSSVALQQLLETDGLKNAAIGISVKQLSDQEKVISYRQDMALTPASVAKILPTWFALQEKGNDYRWRTPVSYTGDIIEERLEGDLIVHAGGDPAVDSRYFSDYSLLTAIVDALQKTGIRRIRGQIRMEGAVRGTDIPGSWPWEDISNYYAALYLPFNYRDNTYVMQFRSGKPGTRAELTSVIPALPGVEIRNEVETAADNKDNAWIFGGPYSSVLCVKGTIPANRSAFKIKGALHDPETVFISELTAKLTECGIRLENQNCKNTKKTDLFYYDSPRVEEIVYYTNKVSCNLFAEALGKLVAPENWPEKAGELLRKAGIQTEGVFLNDACGLSPMDAIPAQVFTDLLVYIGQQRNDAFVRSLPVAGVDGGLAGYCHAFPALKNNLVAKTGSMSGVRCLAGYLTRPDGECLAFTILINHYTCTVSQLQRAVGKFLSSLL